jgi:undecaprenyl-phosphate galactose phosphotransferase
MGRLTCSKQKRKRFFDIIFSSILLIALVPLFLLLALLIKISSKGPVFYPSIRVGLHGKKIICWKLRTMKSNADEALKTLLLDPKIEQEWILHRKLKKDPRITKLGHFLRKTSLDELPQFWNVLKGDLSLVGPRPVSFSEVDLFLSHQGGKVFSVRPGLTGLWQTSGRSNLSYEKRIELEKKYIDTQSFALDLWLIAKTIPLMLFPKGAY